MKALKIVFKLVLILALVALVFFGRNFIKEQVINRAVGIYYVFKGDRAFHKHKLAYAIDYYNQALRFFPSHYTAWYNLGNLYVACEDYYSAVDAYQKSIEHNPKYAMARMNLGIVSAEKLGDFDEAIKQYDAIIHLKNKIWTIPFIMSNKKSSKQNIGLAYYNRGIAYNNKALYLPIDERILKTELLRKSIQSYEKSNKILKKNSDVVFNLAMTHHLMGNYRDAGLNYCKAIKLTPMSYEAHYNLAILLRRIHRYKNSFDELEKAAMLLSFKQNGNTARSGYILGIFGEVSKLYERYGSMEENEEYSIYNTDDQSVDLKKKKGKKKKNLHREAEYIKFNNSNGKIYPDKELDKVMIKNFSMCEGLDYFKNGEDDE